MENTQENQDFNDNVEPLPALQLEQLTRNGVVIATAKHPNGNNRGLSQSYYLRDTCIIEATKLSAEPLHERETPSQRASALASLVKAWDIASDRIRLIKGKPLPGSLRPERKAPKRKAQVHAITEAPEQGTDVGTTSRPKESLSSAGGTTPAG